MDESQLREQIKEKLASYTGIRKECQDVEDQIEKIRSSMESPRVQALDGMPRGSGGGDALAGLVDELKRLDEKYKDKLHRLHAALEEVEGMIEHESLDVTERLLLRYRYVRGLVWEEVCVKLNYCWRQTHNIHSRALDKLVAAEVERLRA